VVRVKIVPFVFGRTSRRSRTLDWSLAAALFANVRVSSGRRRSISRLRGNRQGDVEFEGKRPIEQKYVIVEAARPKVFLILLFLPVAFVWGETRGYAH